MVCRVLSLRIVTEQRQKFGLNPAIDITFTQSAGLTSGEELNKTTQLHKTLPKSLPCHLMGLYQDLGKLARPQRQQRHSDYGLSLQYNFVALSQILRQ
jgi:hypothetical protein